MGDDSPPDNCTCEWSMSTRRKTVVNDDTFTGKLVRVSTDSNCPVHGGE
jgi:hypothetical protein